MPFLSSSFDLKVSNILPGNLFLNPDLFHDLSHLYPLIGDLSLSPLPQYAHRLYLLMLLHDLSLMSMFHYSRLQLLLPCLHLSNNFGISAHTPFRESLSERILLD